MTAQSASSVSFSFGPNATPAQPSILSYKIFWNSGSGTAFTQIAEITVLTSLTFTRSSGISGGVTYDF